MTGRRCTLPHAAAACVVLLEKGAEVNAKGEARAPSPRRRRRISSGTAQERAGAAEAAITRADRSPPTLLAATNASLTGHAQGGNTPLHFAAKNGKAADVCTLLVKHGADLAAENNVRAPARQRGRRCPRCSA